MQQENKNNIERKEVEYEVTTILRNLGIPCHIKGYFYMKEAIVLGIEDITILDKITKKLYPTIAKTFVSTPSRVERAIRHAIELTWSQGRIDPDTIKKEFGPYYLNILPTNSEFIATVVDNYKYR